MVRTWLCLLVLACTAAGQSRAMKAATAHLEVGRYAAAMAELAKLRTKERSSPEVARMKLRAWRGMSAFDKVVEAGKLWLSKRPKDGEVLRWVAEAMLELAAVEERKPLRAMGLREEAIARADAALRVNAGDAKALELKCVALTNLGKGKEALRLAAAKAKKRPGEVAFRLVHARALTWTGKVGDAIGLLNKAAASFPDSAALRIERCAVHVGANQRNEAVRALTEAVKCKQFTDDDRRNAGEYVWMVAGRHHLWDEAVVICDAWIKAHPDHGRAHWWKGYMLERAGRSHDAIACYRQAWKTGGERVPEAAYHLGILVGLAGQLDECLKMLGEGIRLNAPVREGVRTPDHALITLGGVYVSARNFEQAAKVLSVGAEYLPDAYELQQNLGFCLRELGGQQAAKKKRALARRSWKKSAEAYERASAAVRVADVEPSKKAQILNDTGLIYHYHLNLTAKGIKLYKEALSHDPTYVDALENMGVAKLKQKKWKDAITWFDKVLKLVPNRPASVNGKRTAEAALKRRR